VWYKHWPAEQIVTAVPQGHSTPCMHYRSPSCRQTAQSAPSGLQLTGACTHKCTIQCRLDPVTTRATVDWPSGSIWCTKVLPNRYGPTRWHCSPQPDTVRPRTVVCLFTSRLKLVLIYWPSRDFQLTAMTVTTTRRRLKQVLGLTDSRIAWGGQEMERNLSYRYNAKLDGQNR